MCGLETTHRLDYFAMPQALRDAADTALGAPVVQATNQRGGFTPGPACRCELADGRTVFVKACGLELSELATVMHRSEAEILPQLPENFPAPNFLTSVEIDDWVLIASEWVEGTMPREPLTDSSIESVLDLVARLAAAGAACPVEGVNPVGGNPLERANRWAWKKLLDSGDVERLDEWSSRHLAALVELEDDWISAGSGTALLHRDLRIDNMILGTSRSVAVDWPAASRGAPWVDLVGMLPSFHLSGAPEPWTLFDQHPVGAAADADAVTCYLASLAGYFTWASLQPAPVAAPTLRQFQADQGRVSRRWLARRLGWE